MNFGILLGRGRVFQTTPLKQLKTTKMEEEIVYYFKQIYSVHV